MHPLLTIALLWLAIGLLSVPLAILIHELIPVGPFFAAAVALIVAMTVVLLGFLRGPEAINHRGGE